MIALTLAAALAAAVPADEPPPPPELTTAAAAWQSCIQDRVDESSAGENPRAVARAIAIACEASAQALLAAHRQWVEGSALTEREKRSSIRAAERNVAGMPRMIEMMLRASRDD
ncbi:MAG: hypothetical protein QOI38_3060 [Sphingomonadales bacterium]|jgi:hypothetical protein|nr:hypothetical protein [Sphingomonadales bacterium]